MNNNITQRIKKNFNITEEGKSYWLVRTNSGQYFQNYLDGNYIAIGWNYISVADLNKKNSEEIIKEKLKKFIPLEEEKYKKIDFSKSKGKSILTSIYNKIIKFDELKKGDVVLIPAKGSQNIAFGIIESDDIYESKDLTCDFTKRKKVNWITTKPLSDLDNIYYKIINSKHAISSLNSYYDFIDRELNNAFIKDGYGHFVLDITTTDDIAINDLIEVIEQTKKIAQLLNDDLRLGDTIEDNAIRINVQSPGSIEFKFKEGVSAIILSIVMSSFISCANEATHQEVNFGQVPKEQVLTKIGAKLQNEAKLNSTESKRIIDSVDSNYSDFEEASKSYEILNAKIEKTNSL